MSEKTEPAVTKVYLLKGLDCPNCSAKIEKEVGELGGVASSTVNLINQTLTVQAGTSVATSLLDTVKAGSSPAGTSCFSLPEI